jgi:hypothetical protein
MTMRLAAMLALSGWSAAVAAAPPANVAHRADDATAIDRDISRVGAWLKQVSDAAAVSTAAFAAFDAATEPLFSGTPDLARLKADGAAMRSAIQAARAEVRRGEAILQAIEPLPRDVARTVGFEGTTILDDMRAQTRQMLDMLDDFDMLAAHLEKGDAEAVERVAPTVIRSSFLLIDGQRLQLRNRQLLVRPDSSAHKSIGVAISLYQAMAVAGRAWVRAAVDDDADAAATEQRQQLLTIASETETLVQKGRADLATELASLAPERQRVAPDAAGKALLRRAGDLLRNEEKIFALGDELAALLKQRAKIAAADLAAQDSPKLMEELVPFEGRLQEIGRLHAAQMSAGPG